MRSSKKNYSLDKSLFKWLFTLTLMTFLMVLIGGLTRLTDSGLSIVDWQPLIGILPPLNTKSWLESFNLYKDSPEFIIVNKNMTLNEYKYIFWWEWFHRFFARCLGLVFLFPLIYFVIKKRLSKSLLLYLLILFAFGFFQAFIGWWMVKSGLNNNPYVSPYRLAFHLTNATIILSILFWMTLNSLSSFRINFLPRNSIEKLIFFTTIFLIITIITGAFMAGSNAGQSYNTYPLMNGRIIPEGYFLEKSILKNSFENTIAINFNHRWIASISFVTIFFLGIYLKFIKKIQNINSEIFLIIFFVIIQFVLGILTLLSNVKIYLASMHQVNSMLLLGSLIYIYYNIKKKGITNVI